jgi:putative transposase
VTDREPYRHRFPVSIIRHAIWLYHRFALSYRDIQELLLERGINLSHQTLRDWCIKFSDLLTVELRHRQPRPSSRWHLDEVCTKINGITHWLWRAIDEHGVVLDVLLQTTRDAQAAKTFFNRLLGEYSVPDVIHTDQLKSYGAAIKELELLEFVQHEAVISEARYNNLIEQSHRRTRVQERQQLGFKRSRRTQGFLSLHARVSNLHHRSRTRVSASERRFKQVKAFEVWAEVAGIVL